MQQDWKKSELEQQEHEPRPGVGQSVLLILLGSLTPVVLLVFDIPTKITLIFASILIFLPAYLFVRKKGYSVLSVFKINPVSWESLAAAALIGIVSPVINDEIGVIVQLFIKVPPEWQELAVKEFKAASAFDLLAIVTGVIIVAPIVEELLFRGLLQGSFEVRLEWWQAIFQTALIFALLHFLDFMVLQYFLLGVLLGFLCWHSGSVLPAIVVHMVYNGFEILSINLPPDSLPWYVWHGHVNPTVLAVASCILFYSLRWFYRTA